jgi:UV DNA damage endonuclease
MNNTNRQDNGLMSNVKRIGFACKFSEYNAKNVLESVPELNFRTTTITWLNRQTRDVAVAKLWELITHNVAAAYNLVEKVGSLEQSLRMVRMGSDALPAYTHVNWSWFFQQADVIRFCEQEFAKVGQLARKLNVRLSFHPGQFTVLASDNDDIVRRSMIEFEYHADMIRWMGYGQTFQDFKCNVHIAGRRGFQGILDVYPKLSVEARNTITIENEEMKHGLEDCLNLIGTLPIVLDVHHNWVREGEYIALNDSKVQRVLESWRGLRPAMHYSVSREDYLVGHDTTVAPDYAALLESGHKKSKLRAHSDFYWNSECNDWVLSFLESFDIMCESKGKNVASFALHARAKELELI